MPAGRPVEYNQEYIEKVKKYLEECKDSFEVHVSDNGKFTSTTREVKLPTIEGLAIYLDIHKDTIYDWEGKYPEFSDVISKVRSEQAQRLINQGLSGNYNPTIAKLILNKHGYSDKQEIDHTTGGKSFNSFKELPNADLERIASGGSTGVSEEGVSPSQTQELQ